MEFHIYKDTAGEWRWRLTTFNGNNVANSGEGYKNKADCLAIIESISLSAANARVLNDMTGEEIVPR